MTTALSALSGKFLTNVGWVTFASVKRPADGQQFSLLEIASTAAVLLTELVESSEVFHDVDSAALQLTHRCTPAPYEMLTAPPTHSFGDVDP